DFYGILRVTERSSKDGWVRDLTHGLIKHGGQYLNESLKDPPTTYYGPRSGVGIAINALPKGPRRIGVVGLGTGTLASWGRPGDTIPFYEINPGVEKIARTWFSYLIQPIARDSMRLMLLMKN